VVEGDIINKMKIVRIRLMLIATFISISVYTYAQESEQYAKYTQKSDYREGYIIFKDSLKIEGLINSNPLQSSDFFSQVVFVNKDGVKNKYYPSTIKEYGYLTHRYISDNKIFYKVVETGKRVTLYRSMSTSSWTTPNSSGVGSSTVTSFSSSENYYLKRRDEILFTIVKRKNFSKCFSKYFEDCEELTVRINDKKLTYKDISEIVKLYNMCQ
jgi:hypothetical protein